MESRIIVVGSTNTDMIIKVPHLPVPGETVLGGAFTVVQGGKGANQAVAAARAGGKVSFISCVGNDTFGRKSLEELEKEGIDISSVKIINDHPSGVALINVSENGENSISVAPGANSCLFPDDIDNNGHLFKTAGIVLVQLEIPLETVLHVLQKAKKYKVPVILNPAPAVKLESGFLSSASIITPNETEAAILAGHENNITSYIELANSLKKKGVSKVVVTLGEKGAYYTCNESEELVEGHKVIPVDTTAAGDTFNGYLATAIAGGNDMNYAIRLANKAASLSVTRMGAQPSIPYLEELSSSAVRL